MFFSVRHLVIIKHHFVSIKIMTFSGKNETHNLLEFRHEVPQEAPLTLDCFLPFLDSPLRLSTLLYPRSDKQLRPKCDPQIKPKLKRKSRENQVDQC